MASIREASSTPRSRQSSPRVLLSRKRGLTFSKKRRVWSLAVWIGVVSLFFIVNWWMISRLQHKSSPGGGCNKSKIPTTANSTLILQGDLSNYRKDERPHKLMHTRLLAMAAHALAEGERKPEPKDAWKEVLISASSWTPCADRRSWGVSEGNNGYILVSANGGISQQRVAICNAVAISRLLNSTLVLPKFLHSSVWKDKRYVAYVLLPTIVKELPVELRSLDLEAIGSLVTDDEVMKESKPSFLLKKILPVLLKNRIVHFVGFGNRLAFDPIPFELQRLRCRCNFHALQFVEKIQKAGSLLVQRMHHPRSHWVPIEHNLLGRFAVESDMNGEKKSTTRVSRYVAVHARFEIDMAAYSMCSFGGGKEEEEELDAYRAVHFPALTHLKNTRRIPSSSILRSEGKCPLTPEEAVLMLSALGFKRKTRLYIAAGADIYGGKSRMAALKKLYPNLATKESLLSESEIEPFRNFSSQQAALDFIICSAADAFAMTDSGSQFSSLVQGYRMYYGGGKRSTIRPNKRRLASVFSKNATIEWRLFENSVRKATKQSKKTEERPTARSIYRHPRCLECMCLAE